MTGHLGKKQKKNYSIELSTKIKKQLSQLSFKTRQRLAKKINFLEVNPFSHKPLQGYIGHVFRIRFSDRRKELRLIYVVQGNHVYLLEILERKHEYKRK